MTRQEAAERLQSLSDRLGDAGGGGPARDRRDYEALEIAVRSLGVNEGYRFTTPEQGDDRE